MRLYKVDYTEYIGDGHENDNVFWAGTQKEVAAKKREIKDEDILDLEYISEIDIPTDKAGLLKWLNTNVVSQ